MLYSVWTSSRASNAIILETSRPRQLLKIGDSPGDSGTVGAYVYNRPGINFPEAELELDM